MKKHIAIITLVTAALMGCAHQVHTMGTRCKQNSWHPKTYCYSGKKAEVLQDLASNTEKLSERRVFVEVTQGKSSTDVRYFEQKDGNLFTVTEWKTAAGADLLGKINKTIVDNERKCCVGEKVKELFQTELKGEQISQTTITVGTPLETFGPAVKEAVGDTVKVTISLLC